MRIVGVLLGVWLVALVGCGSTPSDEAGYYDFDWPDAVASDGTDGFSSTLLFNRDASVPSAALYAQRGPWPSYTARADLGQRVFYREWFVDWQGPGRQGRDFTFRRFETVREGYTDR